MKCLVAMAKNRVIGKNGELPWHFPEDLKWFKEKTQNGALIMGRKTYDSMKNINLGNRKMIVLSTSLEAPNENITIARNMEELSQLLPIPSGHYWLCGGESLYRQLLKYCTDLYVTELHVCFDGDTKFPVFDKWFEFEEEIQSTDDFTINHYKRKT